MTTASLTNHTLRRRHLGAMLAETRLRLLNMSRYPGQIVLEIVIPVVLAAMPILLGRATAGSAAGDNFALQAGTTRYVAYLLIGSNVFIIVTRAFWDVAYWLRYEQETGTLEAIYLTPTGSLTLASGVALYSSCRSLAAGILAYLLGCAVFRVDPFAGEVWLALAFLVVGVVPLYSMALLFGALVLRVKESNKLVSLMQWVVSFFMGVYFPVAVLPPVLRALALAFPPTWTVNGVRSALLGVGFFFEHWYLDMAVLWAFLLAAPLVAMQTFRRAETSVRRHQGLGDF